MVTNLKFVLRGFVDLLRVVPLLKDDRATFRIVKDPDITMFILVACKAGFYMGRLVQQ